MTSSRTAAAAPRSSRAAGRAARPSRLRRACEAVLVAGTVLAVLAAFGPVWVVRVGVLVAVLAAVLSTLLAWRELSAARRAHAQELLAQTRAHGQVLHEERARNAAVVETLHLRVRQSGVVIEGQRVTITNLRDQISTLDEDRARLAGEVARRETVISTLRRAVRSQAAELATLREEAARPEADIHHMPRRVLAEAEPTADERWPDGSHPAVVDLKTMDTAMVLPNYEEDRRVG